jgi:beta-phosphoglucomutase-like phosphatase (HAD superfamily)
MDGVIVDTEPVHDMPTSSCFQLNIDVNEE